MTNESKFVGNGSDCTGDVFIQAWMTRLENRRVVFFPTDEEVCWVNLADVENGMYGNFNWTENANMVSSCDNMVMNALEMVLPTEFSHPADSL